MVDPLIGSANPESDSGLTRDTFFSGGAGVLALTSIGQSLYVSGLAMPQDHRTGKPAVLRSAPTVPGTATRRFSVAMKTLSSGAPTGRRRARAEAIAAPRKKIGR